MAQSDIAPLLHYYFRSKDKLFEAVFIEAFNKMVPQVIELLKTDLPLFDKITLFTEQYIDLFIKNPFIPGFVLHELSRNPDRVVDLISNMGIQPEIFIHQIQQEIEQGRIIPIDPRQLIVNMLAMCIFPFVAKPILNTIIFQGNTDAFNEFIEDRKTAVPKFIINSIKNE